LPTRVGHMMCHTSLAKYRGTDLLTDWVQGAHFAGNRLPGNSVTDAGIYRFGNRLLIDSVTDIDNRIGIFGNMMSGDA
jgi:hypothetical protein